MPGASVIMSGSEFGSLSVPNRVYCHVAVIQCCADRFKV